MSDIIEIGIPMWGIGGDDELDQQAAIIAETRKNIKKTDGYLDELEEKLETMAKRSNMYISNAIKMPEYDNLKHLLFIDDKFRSNIYLIEEYNQAESLDDLKPHFEETIQLTKKQSDKIVKLMYEYNDLIEEYDEFTEAYDDLVSYHDEIWANVIESLLNFSILQVYDPDVDLEEIERFDLDKHTLLIVRDENDRWVFRYIKKEDEEEFNRLIEEETYDEE